MTPPNKRLLYSRGIYWPAVPGAILRKWFQFLKKSRGRGCRLRIRLHCPALPRAWHCSCRAWRLPVRLQSRLLWVWTRSFIFTVMLLVITYICNSATRGIVCVASLNLTASHTFPGPFEDTSSAVSYEFLLRWPARPCVARERSARLTQSHAAACQAPASGPGDGERYFDTVP